MLDIRKLDYFYYSQNSLNSFIKCPLKFKLKYIEGICWKSDFTAEEDYYKSIEKGLNFHLICERYFSRIPVGEINEDKDLIKWTNSLKNKVPIKDKNTYLTEYEIKITKGDIRLQAKYDLIVITEEKKVQIWDWKTENRKLSKSEMEKRIQTIVYMYVLRESIAKILGLNLKAEDIEMIFWQPQYEEEVIKVIYSEEIHRKNERFLKDILGRIKKYDFYTDFNKALYISHCKFCEFNYFCNNQKVNFINE